MKATTSERGSNMVRILSVVAVLIAVTSPLLAKGPMNRKQAQVQACRLLSFTTDHGDKYIGTTHVWDDFNNKRAPPRYAKCWVGVYSKHNNTHDLDFSPRGYGDTWEEAFDFWRSGKDAER